MKLPSWRIPIDDGDSPVVERLNLLIEMHRETNVLLERLIARGNSSDQRRSAGAPSGSKRRPIAAARRRKASGQRSAGDSQRSPGLHEEIEAVLREAEHPLPANMIADRIRERAKYAPPRSSKPLSGSSVNSRVANPAYRSRFIRRDDGIWLASPDDPSASAPSLRLQDADAEEIAQDRLRRAGDVA